MFHSFFLDYLNTTCNICNIQILQLHNKYLYLDEYENVTTTNKEEELQSDDLQDKLLSNSSFSIENDLTSE